MTKEEIAAALETTPETLTLALTLATQIQGGARCDALLSQAQSGMARVQGRIDAFRAAINEGRLDVTPPTWDELVKTFAAEGG